MNEPIRLPRDQYGHPIITSDIARQIVAMADVFGEENWQPLEKRIAALESRKSSGFIGDVITIGGSGKSTTQDASSTQGCLHIVGPDGVAHPAGTPEAIAAITDIPKPTAHGDEAAYKALLKLPLLWDAGGRTRAPFIEEAQRIVQAIRDGKVPGVGDNLFSGRLVPKLEAEIARLKADLAAAKLGAEKAEKGFANIRNGSGVADEIARWQKAETQVAALAALLREYRLCRGVVPSELLSRIDAALAAAEGK